MYKSTENKWKWTSLKWVGIIGLEKNRLGYFGLKFRKIRAYQCYYLYVNQIDWTELELTWLKSKEFNLLFI